MHWLISILALFGAVFLSSQVHRLWVNSCRRRLPLTLEPPKPESVELLTLMSQQTGATVLAGNRVKLLVNGDAIFPAMLQSIRRANHTVHLLTYIYWTGDIAQQFAQALMDAASRGVTVRLILDAFGAHHMDKNLVAQIKHSGVNVAWFRPVAWYTVHRINQRTHRKVLVVDDSIGFVGGVGIAGEWEGDARNSNEWRDNHFRIEGPSVESLQGAFKDNWRTASGEVLSSEGDVTSSSAAGTETERANECRLLTLYTSPHGRLSHVALSYWAALQLARRQLDIATPYFVPNQEMLQALCAVAARGVSVRLLVPGAHSDSRLARWAGESFYRCLLDAGVQIYEFLPSMFHVKSVCIDDRYALFGSANFDNRSFELNDEVLLIADSPDLVSQITSAFDDDASRSLLMKEPASSRGRNLRWKLAHLALVFRSHL